MPDYKAQPDDTIQPLVRRLESLTEGDVAMDLIVRHGPPAIPALEEFLLIGKPRSLSLPRCRAVKALGALGAKNTLLAYFRQYEIPQDSVVAFAEDAVRSAVAEELLRWKTQEVYTALIAAARQRGTPGIIHSIGDFRDPAGLELLFETLEDDICRTEADAALRLLPAEAGAYALQTFRGQTSMQLNGPRAERRLRSILCLLSEMDVPESEWPYIEPFLGTNEPIIVLTAMKIGLQHASSGPARTLFLRLFLLADRFDWFEESLATELCDAHAREARSAADEVVTERLAQGEQIRWTSPAWRILDHVLYKRLSHPR